MQRSKSVKTEQQSPEQKLKKLRSQIYKPYKSVLSTENQQQFSAESINKNYSLQLKSANKKSLLFNSAHSKMENANRQTKLPLIIKKKASLLFYDAAQPTTVTDLVHDPYLNGKIKNLRDKIYSSLKQGTNEYVFLTIVEKYQFQFLQNCFYKKEKDAKQVITRMLNYAIDLNLIDYLCFSLKILADLNYQCFNIEKAFFYFNQCRKCSILIGQYQLMAESLIKMAECANQSKLYQESIRFLKKALQYIWYYDMTNLQLRVYDQIGKAYYMMGDAQNAKNFHYKYFSGRAQPKDSSIRLLSRQSLILEGLAQMKVIRTITSVFLWMIHIPVKNCQDLSQFDQNQNSEITVNQSPRKNYSKNMKYYQQFKSLKQAVNGVFSSDLFKNQLGEMYIDKVNWADPIRKKKFLSYDIQRNNHLKSQGIPFQNYFSKVKSNKSKFVVLKSLKKKIKTEGNEGPQQQNDQNKQLTGKDLAEWFANITSQAIKKNKRHSQQMANRVCLRGLNKYPQPKINKFRVLYNEFFEYAGSHFYKKF